MKYKEDERKIKFPLAFIEDDNQRELDRLAALNIHLLKLKMINRSEITRTIVAEINPCERQYYKARLNYYVYRWKDRKYES